MRPGTAVIKEDKKVFPNCTDEYHYQREIMKHVSIEEKELQVIMKMVSITPRSGGNFMNLSILNDQHIIVEELHNILYYVKFQKDYEKQKDLYRLQ